MKKLQCLCLFFVLFLSNCLAKDVPLKWLCDVAGNGKVRFFLTRQGMIYLDSSEGLKALELPGDIIQIRMHGDTLYALREEGTLWSFENSKLRVFPRDLPIRQFEFYGDNILALTFSGDLQRIALNGERHDLLMGRKLAVMQLGGEKLYFLDDWGRFFEYRLETSAFVKRDDKPDNIALAATDHAAFILNKNGEVFRFEDMEFYPFYEKGVKAITAKGELFFYVNSKGELWELNLAADSRRVLKSGGEPVERLYAGHSELFCQLKGGHTVSYPMRHLYQKIQKKNRQKWNQDLYPMMWGYSRMAGNGTSLGNQ